MNTETIDNPYIITYSNHFVFESKTFAFRKKELFDISGIPSLIARTEQGWWIGRKLLSKAKAKKLVKHEPKEVDISNLQWFEQEKLNGVFNLV